MDWRQKMGEEYYGDKKLTSDYNEAKFQIYRLHNSWVLCNDYRRKGNLIGLKWELDNIWDELSPKSKMRNKEKDEIEIKKLDLDIKKTKNKKELYESLRKKYRKLKLIQEDVGMGGKMQFEDAGLMDD